MIVKVPRTIDKRNQSSQIRPPLPNSSPPPSKKLQPIIYLPIFCVLDVKLAYINRVCAWCPACTLHTVCLTVTPSFPNVADEFVSGHSETNPLPKRSWSPTVKGLTDCRSFICRQMPRQHYRQKSKSWWLNPKHSVNRIRQSNTGKQFLPTELHAYDA